MDIPDTPDLARTLSARRESLRPNLIFTLVYALCFTPVVGWGASGAWLVAYGLLQGAEHLLFGAERAVSRPSGRRVALLLLALNSTVFGSLAIAAILARGPWGLVCGGLFLGVGVLKTVVTSQKSRAAYAASMAPYGVYLLATAIFAWRLSGASFFGVAIGMISVLLVFSSTLLWRSAADALEAQREAREEAEEGRRVAEAAVDAKSAFIAMVSHELRTPISAILAGAEAIGRRPGAEAALRSEAELIGQSGRMMRSLLNDLLDLAKMEAGAMRIETVAFDPTALINDTCAFWRAEAARKGLTLSVEGLEHVAAWRRGDPTRLRQVLNNLFSNALKFTEAGGVILALDRDGDHFAFCVADSGPGLTPAQLERLFTPFEQGSASTARTHGGTGLGLSISRHLAQLMGGDLTADGAPGQGAIFTLTVPLELAEPAEASAQEALELTAAIRVLVVDDHEINRRAVALMLEPFGIELTEAASGDEALALSATAAFDVILMDVYMPGLDGRETCRRLRAGAGPNRATPVIACTASGNDRDLAECWEAGMTGQAAKPFDPRDLVAAVSQALEPADETQAAVA
ncbi:ATP-binding protein [Phenylobacterium aquaticum]|uniref:ATP-binding protein n=1 Tax=Phenylobacterium aquaticum TaxID=1763816 RepID=UPI0026EDDA7E|nr:ATP-binding protein [Phenylobacterium aquaticum]